MTKRPTCPHCLRAQSGCICSAVRPLAHPVQVALLQHPDEVRHAKGTAWLAQQCLAGSRLWVGDRFAPEQLHEALAAPWCDADRTRPRRTLLLYPPTPGESAAPLPARWLEQPARLRLVVLDGTWRHSRQLLRQHPALQQLPRLALAPTAPSRYAIRLAHAPHQLSTIEAIASALAQLEPGNAEVARLPEALAAFVALQQRLQAAHQRPGYAAPHSSQETTP